MLLKLTRSHCAIVATLLMLAFSTTSYAQRTSDTPQQANRPTPQSAEACAAEKNNFRKAYGEVAAYINQMDLKQGVNFFRDLPPPVRRGVYIAMSPEKRKLIYYYALEHVIQPDVPLETKRALLNKLEEIEARFNIKSDEDAQRQSPELAKAFEALYEQASDQEKELMKGAMDFFFPKSILPFVEGEFAITPEGKQCFVELSKYSPTFKAMVDSGYLDKKVALYHSQYNQDTGNGTSDGIFWCAEKLML
ncbi:hypothetical protein J8C06_08265 [Chloracidobacterium validum]|uniref:Uncharacterized protein n=1 Tax=Chloracidobacterium validum TaxID=2821543 RepID=A0ABX8B5V4_9BACT|nr:hypothetical protein [Chloracidobacterium validum]QUW02349.1 hypothetical protein J8C06_08265 [Chloracidobacterium validum]